jgi:hypothetical protein
VPRGWLERDDIVVEKFRPERYRGKFVLREWYFFGAGDYFNAETSDRPIFTSGADTPSLAAPPPDAIRQVRRDLGIDYGKIDYVVADDGEAVLFDVNKTLGVSDPSSARVRAMSTTLAKGVDGFLSALSPPTAVAS